MTEILHDKKDQLDRIVAHLIPGEALKAVFDCKGAGTGFVGVTDQRVIFYDQGVLTKKKAMVSIPYNRVIGVSSADSGGLIFKSTELTLLTAAVAAPSTSSTSTSTSARQLRRTSYGSTIVARGTLWFTPTG